MSFNSKTTIFLKNVCVFKQRCIHQLFSFSKLLVICSSCSIQLSKKEINGFPYPDAKVELNIKNKQKTLLYYLQGQRSLSKTCISSLCPLRGFGASILLVCQWKEQYHDNNFEWNLIFQNICKKSTAIVNVPLKSIFMN